MKKIFSLLGLLMLVCSSTFAAGFTRTLNANIQVAGYKDAVLYDFQNNNPEVLPASGDLRYRDGGIWGLHNFGSGTRSAEVGISVKQNQLLILQVYTGQSVTSVSSASVNATLSSSTGYACYDITADANSITIAVPRYSGIVAAVVMDKDNSAATADYTINYTLGSTVVKTTSGTMAVGAKVNADANFYVDTQKYFVVDGSQTEFDIASSGNTFSVPVRVANNYSYTVNAVAGSQTTALATGSVVEGESVSVPKC